MACKTGSSVGTHANCLQVFCTFGTNLCAQSVQINKISASELSRKFIKTALLVGYVQSAQRFFFPDFPFFLLLFKRGWVERGARNSSLHLAGLSFLLPAICQPPPPPPPPPSPYENVNLLFFFSRVEWNGRKEGGGKLSVQSG